jgi:putative membrane protein
LVVRVGLTTDTDAMRKERVLREAEFTTNVVRYRVLASLAALGISVVGIPLIPIIVPIVYWYYVRYYGKLRVVLTSRELKVRRGLMVVEEKAIPLEKITDLAVYQGPIMRAMGLKGIKVETAGQTTTTGSPLVTVIGIVDTDEFRDLVLEQRDRIADRDDSPASGTLPATGTTGGTSSVVAGDPAVLAVLTEIRDLLRHIEERGSRP